MTWVAVGVGGAAAAGSIFSGVFGAAGAQRQAGAITEAANTASRTALELNNRARADLAPFREMGIQTGNTLRDLLLGGGDVSAVTKASPLFQFQSEMGMRNINRELASRGLFNSGAGLETLQRFNNQLVGEEADRLYGRLQNMTTMGANAAGGMATGTNQTGATVANLQTQSGIAQGGAIANQYNAIGSAYAGGFNALSGGFRQYAEQQLYQPLINSLSFSPGAPSAQVGNLTQFKSGGSPFLVNTPGGSSTATFAGG
jgi:hypothetical protein